MRNLNTALPFLLFFFFVIIFVGRLTQIRPYQELSESLSAGRAADSKREIVRATVLGSEDEILVAGRGTADFLTNGASVADLSETADKIVLDFDPPLIVDTTGAAPVTLSSAVVAGKERTVVRVGDVVTVFGRRVAAGPLRADIISALPPAELYSDRLRAAVRVFVGGLGMLAAFFMLPPVARFLNRFAGEIRRGRASRRRRAELRERGECPACQPSAAPGFIARVECGRALEAARS
jgi:hypothetical protein